MVHQQTSRAEIAKRVGDYAPGLVTAAHVSAIDNLRRIQAGTRRQLRTDYAMQARALGGEAAEMPDEEEMGNLIVTGDIYGSNSADIVRALGNGTAGETPTPPPAPTPPPSNGVSRLAKAALIAAGLLGGAGIGAGVPWLLGAYDKAGDTTVITPNGGYGVDVVPGGAEP